MNFDNLIKMFKKAGLVLEILSEPIRKGAGMSSIFQIDIVSIPKKFLRKEKFRIYPGSEKTLIQIRNVDKQKHQLVLMVKEPSVEFEEEVKLNVFVTIEELNRRLKIDKNMISVKKVGKKKAIIRRKTDNSVRYFLMGVDERQLFIAQLTNPATTVTAARKLLGRTIEFSDGKRKGSSADRQGEWFFLETTQLTRDSIGNAIKKNQTAIQYNVSIGEKLGRRGGKPHMAEEFIFIADKNGNIMSPGSRYSAMFHHRAFVRGKVKHLDHKTVKFKHWREVIANNEEIASQSNSSGVMWID